MTNMSGVGFFFIADGDHDRITITIVLDGEPSGGYGGYRGSGHSLFAAAGRPKSL